MSNDKDQFDVALVNAF